MKTNIIKPLILLVLLGFTFTSCSKDDGNNPDDDPSGNSGQPHHYDITAGEEHFSGEIDNVYGVDGENGAITAISIYEKQDGKNYVLFTLKNNDFYIYGGFEYPNDEDNKVAISEDGDSEIIFSPAPSQIGYQSVSGTADIEIGKKISIVSGAAQFAQLKIKFNGTFSYDNADDDEMITSASGTIVVNLPPGY